VVVRGGRRGQHAVDEIDVTMEERLGRYVVRVEQQKNFRWGPIQITWGGDFEVRISCPPGSDLDLEGGSTDVRADGELGEVAVRTASGDVRVQSAARELDVKTASGDITVATAASRAALVTVSGDVEVERTDASLTARSVSGDLVVGRSAGALGVSTTSGDVDVKAVVDGDVRVQTVSGDVRIGIAKGTRTWIDAGSVSGRLESELGLEDAEPPPADEREDAVVPLHVKTVSGDVSVVRAAAAYTA
jgi:DUF4097 and DUF4098 domain-containing protein YvlB